MQSLWRLTDRYQRGYIRDSLQKGLPLPRNLDRVHLDLLRRHPGFNIYQQAHDMDRHLQLPFADLSLHRHSRSRNLVPREK